METQQTLRSLRAVLNSKDGMSAIITLRTVKDIAGGFYVPAKFISKRPGSDDIVLFDLQHFKNDVAYYIETDEDPRAYSVLGL